MGVNESFKENTERERKKMVKYSHCRVVENEDTSKDVENLVV